MKIVKIIFIVVGVLFIGGFCFMNLYSTEVASLDEIQIENISDDSENKILTIDVKVRTENKYYQYIGSEWDTNIVDGKKVIYCRVYKKLGFQGGIDNGKTFSFKIPREILTEEGIKSIYYDNNKEATLIWEK
ncbi:MAG: hypothetical protein Q4C51_02445 [Clostridia bacterium]|nr:hypothetical protein [Clostridia bacterium]